MKTYKLLFTVLISFLIFESAQSTCNPEPSLVTPGLYPPANDFPCMERGVVFDEFISIMQLNAFDPGGGIFPGGAFPISSLTIDSITNLPCGINWSTNKPGNLFLANEKGCIFLEGTTNDPAAEYAIEIWASMELDFGSGGFPFPFPFPPIDVNLAESGFAYTLRINESGDACQDIGTQGEGIACLFIESPELSAYSICEGEEILDITFSTGTNFIGGNVFTAQLSDENGDFSNPVDIGTLPGVAGGIINANLPQGLPPSSDYLVRIVSSAPPVTGFVSDIPLELNPLPAKPKITQSQTILSSSEIFWNQWYLDGQLIEDATNQHIEATHSGVYTVQVIDDKGCTSEMSEPLSVNLSSVGENLHSVVIDVYPNPSYGMYQLHFENIYAGIVEVSVLNIAGAKVYQLRLNTTSGEHNYSLNLTDQVPGLYLLKIISNDEVYVKQLVKW